MLALGDLDSCVVVVYRTRLLLFSVKTHVRWLVANAMLLAGAYLRAWMTRQHTCISQQYCRP